MSAPARPHGGRLVNAVASADRRASLLDEARELPRLPIKASTVYDLWAIASGAFSPIEGFLGRAEAESVLHGHRLPSGLPWSIPVLLEIPANADRVQPGDDVALVDAAGAILSTLSLEDVYTLDPTRTARLVFGTDDATHPGVAPWRAQSGLYAAGSVRWVAPRPFGFAPTPRETRNLIEERGWRTVCGYQTRNPPHRAHEAVHKVALSLVDGLLLQPAIGPKRAGDFRDEVLVDAYEALVSNYYPSARVELSPLPYAMRYAGPREALLQAIARKNFGCTHVVIGRDHAGVGGFYGPEEAIEYVSRFPDLGIAPVAVRGDHFWCRACEGVESERTCGHAVDCRETFSGTEVRARLRAGYEIPPTIMRPEVAAAVRKHERLFQDA